MNRPSTFVRAALAALFALILAAPAFAGGQSISVSVPSDPSSGAALLVNAYNCGAACKAPLTGRAEGIVNGERRTIPLELKPARKLGTYAVAKQWPSRGSWVLVFSWKDHGHASALVTLGPDGRIETASSRAAEPKKAAAALKVAYGPVSADDVSAALAAVTN
jgi:hypothetical protein